MRLAELDPRWIHENVFVFRCPHCRERWLSCKNIPMSAGDQCALFEREFGEDVSNVTPSRPAFAWTISGKAFETMTVRPSSGCWHGHITNGAIE